MTIADHIPDTLVELPAIPLAAGIGRLAETDDEHRTWRILEGLDESLDLAGEYERKVELEAVAESLEVADSEDLRRAGTALHVLALYVESRRVSGGLYDGEHPSIGLYARMLRKPDLDLERIIPAGDVASTGNEKVTAFWRPNR